MVEIYFQYNMTNCLLFINSDAPSRSEALLSPDRIYFWYLLAGDGGVSRLPSNKRFVSSDSRFSFI